MKNYALLLLLLLPIQGFAATELCHVKNTDYTVGLEKTSGIHNFILSLYHGKELIRQSLAREVLTIKGGIYQGEMTLVVDFDGNRFDSAIVSGDCE